MRITKQGCVRPTHTEVYEGGFIELRAVEIDLKAKRAEVVAVMGSEEAPGVVLGASEHTLHTVGDRKADTFLEFPEFAGYEVVSADVSRYTLTVVFGKRKP